MAVTVADGGQTSCITPTSVVETATYSEVERVDPDLGSLDVYASPDAKNCPVLVWVHGGSWQAGDKATRLTRVKADHFVDRGWVFVSVNYRLAAPDNDVRWPDFGDDVAASVAWLVGNVADFGGDPTQITLMGHSSGAHLVSIVGTNNELLTRQGLGLDALRCVVSLDSVTHDLTDPPPWEVDIVELAFPDNASQIDGSPTLQANRIADGELPSYLIVTRGRRERIDSSERFAEALVDAGGQAQVADVTPYDHGQVSTELGVPGERLVTPIVDGFLSGCAASPPIEGS